MDFFTELTTLHFGTGECFDFEVKRSKFKVVVESGFPHLLESPGFFL